MDVERDQSHEMSMLNPVKFIHVQKICQFRPSRLIANSIFSLLLLLSVSYLKEPLDQGLKCLILVAFEAAVVLKKSKNEFAKIAIYLPLSAYCSVLLLKPFPIRHLLLWPWKT